MSEANYPKILQNNIDFFYANIKTLISLRPNITFDFKDCGLGMSIKIKSGPQIKGIDQNINRQQIIKFLNCSIILNCFSLLEASLEWILLHGLNTKGLTGIQEKIMLKYIDNILNISGIDNYSKEFKFITGREIKKFFDANENKLFSIITNFYVVRNLLVHGSSTRKIYIPIEIGGKIRLDEDDKKYQEFLKMLKDHIEINASDEHLTLETLLLMNEVADLLVNATIKISKRLSLGNQAKFIKENI